MRDSTSLGCLALDYDTRHLAGDAFDGDRVIAESARAPSARARAVHGVRPQGPTMYHLPVPEQQDWRVVFTGVLGVFWPWTGLLSYSERWTLSRHASRG